MRYSLIDAEAAPPPTKRPVTNRGTLADQLIAALVPGKVARVDLSEGESVRGTKTSITRAARRRNQRVATWDHDGAVFVQLVEA